MATENRKQYTILLVDDTSENIALLNAALRDEYNIKVATAAGKPLKLPGPCRWISFCWM